MQLLTLAREHGWSPKRTTPAPSWLEMQDLTAGALGRDARYHDSPEATETLDFARELFAERWAGERTGYENPPYPKANYICLADAAALADALERGLPKAEEQERQSEGVEHLSAWFVTRVIQFMRRGGFVFGSPD